MNLKMINKYFSKKNAAGRLEMNMGIVFRIIAIICITNKMHIVFTSQIKVAYRMHQDQWAHQVLQNMSLREKIGQLFFVAVSHVHEGQEILYCPRS